MENAAMLGVHKFQGTEFPVIILTTTIFRQQDSVSFIDGTPNLLNVAVSRAKHLFITVGSAEKFAFGRLKKILQASKEKGILIENVEFDETEERIKKKTQQIEFMKNMDINVELIPDVFSHMDFFTSIPKAVENKLVIICPWIKYHNLKHFSLSILRELSDKKIDIKIVYGYSENDSEDMQAKSALESMANIKLYKKPNFTHAKGLIIDNSILVIGSFNWLSHNYYNYEKDSCHANVFLRNEMSLITKDKNTINKIINNYNMQ